MKRKVTVTGKESDDLYLEEIDHSDGDVLLKWKNDNREAFFFTETITPEMQKSWMEQYDSDPNNFMFILKFMDKRVGIMGFKILPEGAEIYNVILGDKESGGKGIMSRGMGLMINFIMKKDIQRIFLRVLNSNKNAIRWYKKNGFVIKGKLESYHLMEIDFSKFTPNKISVEER